MKKILSLLVVLALIFISIGCSPEVSIEENAPNENEVVENNSEENAESTEEVTEPVKELATGEGESVRVNLSDSGKRFISFQKDTPYDSLDGKTYVKNDLSPTWSFIANKLKIEIVDTNPHNGTKVDAALDLEVSTNLESAEIFGGNAIQFAEYGQNGLFLPLNKYEEYLPNFTQFLNENPVVRSSITSGDGNIYFSPYFDGIEGIERTLMIRHDLVEKLLDEDMTWSKAGNLDTYYEPFYPEAYDAKILGTTKTITRTQGSVESIIKQMNDASSDKMLNGDKAVQLLRDYIDAVYMSGSQYAKRSEVFLSGNAAYNTDELIALMRAAKLNEEELIGKGQTLHILFPRENKESRWDDLLKFLSVWKVSGVDSRHNKSYFGTDGRVYDARGEENTLLALERMNDLYNEGLLLKDFHEGMGNSISNYRTELFRSEGDKVPNGFISFDYITSTINAVKADHSGVSEVEYSTILPPALNWFDENEYIHFSESSRSVKPMGIGVANHVSEEENLLAATLKIIDYPFSPEGKIVTVFGPTDFWTFDESGIEGTDYFMFQGEKWPVIKQEVLDEMSVVADGNFSVYYREYLGSTLPIGFVKSQALEYQTQTEMASKGQARLDDAIAAGALQTLELGTNSKPHMNVVPTVFATTRAEDNQIASLGQFGQTFTDTYYRVMVEGTYGEFSSREEFLKAIADSGFDAYIEFTNAAWERMNK